MATLGSFYKEQIEWARSEPWYPELIVKVDRTTCIGAQVDVVTSSTVITVRNLLEQKCDLPSTAVSLILDMAEYWTHSFIVYDGECPGSSAGPISRFDFPIRANGQGLGCIRKVVYTTKSHHWCK